MGYKRKQYKKKPIKKKKSIKRNGKAARSLRIKK